MAMLCRFIQFFPFVLLPFGALLAQSPDAADTRSNTEMSVAETSPETGQLLLPEGGKLDPGVALSTGEMHALVEAKHARIHQAHEAIEALVKRPAQKAEQRNVLRQQAATVSASERTMRQSISAQKGLVDRQLLRVAETPAVAEDVWDYIFSFQLARRYFETKQYEQARSVAHETITRMDTHLRTLDPKLDEAMYAEIIKVKTLLYDKVLYDKDSIQTMLAEVALLLPENETVQRLSQRHLRD